MPKNHSELTAERLRELLSYDPDTGFFRWVVKRNGVPVGPEIRSVDKEGYVQIRVDQRKYYAHRLAWLYVHGRWPADQLDHISGIRSENRIANLREATNAENGQNCVVRRNNASGHPGVSWDKQCGKWRARIKVNRKGIHLGKFDNIGDAIAARAKAKAELHRFHPTDRKAAR
jgi:hypothetical protein